MQELYDAFINAIDSITINRSRPQRKIEVLTFGDFDFDEQAIPVTRNGIVVNEEQIMSYRDKENEYLGCGGYDDFEDTI